MQLITSIFTFHKQTPSSFHILNLNLNFSLHLFLLCLVIALLGNWAKTSWELRERENVSNQDWKKEERSCLLRSQLTCDLCFSGGAWSWTHLHHIILLHTIISLDRIASAPTHYHICHHSWGVMWCDVCLHRGNWSSPQHINWCTRGENKKNTP